MKRSALRRRYGRSKFIGPRRMRLSDAKHELRALGLTLKHDTGYGEYVVRKKTSRGYEDYFTTDLADAVATGRRMARR